MVNLESLIEAVREDLDDLDGVSDDVLIVAYNVCKIGRARIVLHGPSVCEPVVSECMRWLRVNYQDFNGIRQDCETLLRSFAKRREAMGS